MHTGNEGSFEGGSRPVGPPGYPSGGWAPPPPAGPAGAWAPPPPAGPAGGWGPPPAPPPSGPRRGRAGYGLLIVAAALIAALAVTGVGIGTWSLTRGGIGATSQAPIRPVPQSGSSAAQGSQQPDTQAVAARVDPSVVDINTTLTSASLRGGTARAAGTGIIVGSSGDVLTNNHVVQGATSIKVTIQGRAGSYPASVVGTDASADVALVKIQGVSGLPAARLADSSGLTVGQPVVAIGNALGQGGTPSATTGSITALNQSITAANDTGASEQLTGMIQVDAPISPGDSGGPLVNSASQVVGMVTAGDTGGSTHSTTSTTGFAIPVNTAVGIVNQMKAGRSGSGIVLGQPAFLGVDVQNLDATTATRLGLSVSSGALVVGVVQGSPAEQAGIPQNAVITAIDGSSIGSADALGPAIQAHKPGDHIQVTWVDQDGTHSASLTAVAGPPA
jgi:S1-C subfamily serine protease